MTASLEAVLIEAQPAAAFVPPSDEYPVMTASVTPGFNMIDLRDTSVGRSLRDVVQGSIKPTGSISSYFYPEGIGRLIKAAFLNNVTSQQPDAGGAATVWEHAFLAGANQGVDGLSMQYQYDGATALNVLLALVDKVTITLTQDDIAQISIDFQARDLSEAGGLWNDGTASPAIVASPSSLITTQIPFTFIGGVITYGGTPAIDPTTKVMSISGGATLAEIEKIEISIENSAEQKVYIGAQTPGKIRAGDLNISVTFDVDQDTIDTTYFDDLYANTEVAVDLSMIGAVIEDVQVYEAKITLPSVKISAADFAEISGSQDSRVSSIEGSAIQNKTLEQAIGIMLRDTQTSY